jgi:hypothetical protein
MRARCSVLVALPVLGGVEHDYRLAAQTLRETTWIVQPSCPRAHGFGPALGRFVAVASNSSSLSMLCGLAR